MFISGHEESYNPPSEYLPTQEEVSCLLFFGGFCFVLFLVLVFQGNSMLELVYCIC